MTRTKMVQFSVQISERAHTQLAERAYEQGTSAGAVARRHIYAGLGLSPAGDEQIARPRNGRKS